MAESSPHKIERTRPDKVGLAYAVESVTCNEKHAIPFLVEDTKIPAELKFESLNDFYPENIVKQVEPFK